MPLRKWWTTVRDSLWFIPSIWVVASIMLAFAVIAVDRSTPRFASDLPLVFGGGADGARGLLSSIAGSMITVAGVTFSITIVALQLASSQLSPRVLRNFMRDRRSQTVLGAFIGAFTYSIIVLRSIRAAGSDIAEFVPSVAVSVGILFALLAMAMFVFFIHHIASRIQLSAIVANIADETTGQVRHEWTDSDENGDGAQLPSAAPGVVTADSSGYLQLIDIDGLRALAEENRLLVRLEVSPGHWVQQDAPLFSVWPAAAASEASAAELRRHVSMGAQRSIEQDAAFGIRQLVDVSLKAISPGINDPTSATDCIVRLGQILVAAGRRHHPRRVFRGDDRELRLVLPYVDWDGLVDLAFDQLRQYGAGSPDISVALATTLRTIAVSVPPHRHPALGRQLRLIAESVSGVAPESDRQRVRQAVNRALEAVKG
ncbi:MAG TPA: DUF2254 domain-containing protein [Candidatus Limnocylindrales bacterium]|nr:DUF2254 domain-containing protein [Candidatus Limnocylindrales bacterium]